jgi:NAD(P)-dependent dehydrogenase (short-subunit alcohol dehydrogenase family)
MPGCVDCKVIGINLTGVFLMTQAMLPTRRSL